MIGDWLCPHHSLCSQMQPPAGVDGSVGEPRVGWGEEQMGSSLLESAGGEDRARGP